MGKISIPGIDKANDLIPNLIIGVTKYDEIMSKILYYVHADMEVKQAKKEYLKWAKANNLDCADLEKVSDAWFATVGEYCYVINRGGQMPKDYIDHLHNKYAELVERGKNKKQEEDLDADGMPVEKPTINIQERIREKAADICSEFDTWIDVICSNPKADTVKFDPLAKMKIADLKQVHANYVVKFYEPELAEINLLIAGKDQDLKEGYSNLSKEQIKSVKELYEKIISSAQMVKDTAKATRAPRKKKPVSFDKQVKKIKYKLEDPAYSLVSINPVEIIGASELWVFNTKNRKIGRYLALDSAGLGVKGTTITNFSVASTEKTLRKPADQLKRLKDGGKIILRKFMEEINAVDTELTGRINENIILVKTIK